MVIAVDIDGMLDAFGDFFQVSIPAWQKAGAKVGIITGRPESEKLHIFAILAKVHITMDFLLFKPNEFEKVPNGVWKAVMCRILKVDLLFDDLQHDDPAFVSDFIQVVEGTRVLTPINYKVKPDAAGYTIRDYVEQIVTALKAHEK